MRTDAAKKFSDDAWSISDDERVGRRRERHDLSGFLALAEVAGGSNECFS
jgi:hypothetical protein